jgi:hypothetical protein
MVKLVKDKLQDSSIVMKNVQQRILSAETRIKTIIEDYGNDLIAPDEHVQPKNDLFVFTK